MTLRSICQGFVAGFILQLLVQTPALAQEPSADPSVRIAEIRAQALESIRLYSENGGPGPRSPYLPQSRTDEEMYHYGRLRRISLELHRLDPKRFAQARSLENLARLLVDEPVEGPALAKLLRTARSAPDFEERVYEWRKVVDPNLDESQTPSNRELTRIRSDVLRILEKYKAVGRPNPKSTQSEEASDSDHLEQLSRRLLKLDPKAYGHEAGFSRLALIFDDIDPEVATLLRNTRSSKTFLELVKKRTGQDPLLASKQKVLEDLREELILIYSEYARTGGPSFYPKDPKSREGIYEIKAARRISEISLRVSEIDPERFGEKASKEALARLIEEVPFYGTPLARLLRTHRLHSTYKRYARDWVRTLRNSSPRRSGQSAEVDCINLRLRLESEP